MRLALAVLMAGCASSGSPLQRVLKTDAPQFTVKAPAIADADLGRHLEGAQPATNACFEGAVHGEPLASWTARTLQYSGAGDAKLGLDFGPAFQLAGAASGQHTVSVTLKGVSLLRLDEVHFVPGASCAGAETMPEYVAGKQFQVLTRALKAESLDLAEGHAGQAGLTVNYNKIGGHLAGTVADTSHWEGLGLYFAQYAEPIVVRRTDAPAASLVAGQSVQLGDCSFLLEAVGDTVWDGTVSCMSGQRWPLHGQKLGLYAVAATAPGVSYVVRVQRGSGVALGDVDFHRFNAVSERPR